MANPEIKIKAKRLLVLRAAKAIGPGATISAVAERTGYSREFVRYAMRLLRIAPAAGGRHREVTNSADLHVVAVDLLLGSTLRRTENRFGAYVE